MPENDKIYADDAVALLEELTREANYDTYANQNKLAKLLGLTDGEGEGSGEQLRRVKGTRPGRHGWPLHYDHVEHIRDALYEIADDYSGPASFIRVANKALRQRGIIVPGLARAVDGSSSSNLKEQWAGRPDLDRGFVNACDLIVTRCRKDYGGDRAKADGDKMFGSPLAAVLAAALGEECTIVDGAGNKTHIGRDGLGPVDLTLPETVKDLAVSVLPRRLLAALESRLSISRQLVIKRLLSPDWDKELTVCIRNYFSGDGGHRFALMVEGCQRLLTGYSDDDLLWDRVSGLFKAISLQGNNTAAVRESLRVIKAYARETVINGEASGGPPRCPSFRLGSQPLAG